MFMHVRCVYMHVCLCVCACGAVSTLVCVRMCAAVSMCAAESMCVSASMFVCVWRARVMITAAVIVPGSHSLLFVFRMSNTSNWLHTNGAVQPNLIVYRLGCATHFIYFFLRIRDGFMGGGGDLRVGE